MVDYAEYGAKVFQKNFKRFGSFRSLCEYRFKNPLSDSSQSIYIIFDEFVKEKIDEEVIPFIDKIGIFPSLDLIQAPDYDDEIVEIATNIIWKVKRIMNDPKPIAYELHVRPTGVV